MQADPTFLGLVEDVRGATISVRLDADTVSGLSVIDGHAYRVGQIGSFVRIPIGYLDLYGVVSQVGAGAVPPNVNEEETQYGRRWMTVQLVGEAAQGSSFRRGLAQHPTIDDSVHLLAERDLKLLYGSREAPDCVRVGRLANAETIPALLNIDRLVTRHSAVVGATGTGKSTTVARLLESIVASSRFPSARILVFDIHGEYASALEDHADVFSVGSSTDPLNVPYWAMTFDELLPLTTGELENAERAALQDKIVDLKRAALAQTPRDGVQSRTLTVDSPVPFSLHELWLDLHKLVNATHTKPASGQSGATEAFLTDDNGVPVELGDALKVIPPKYEPQRDKEIFLSGSRLNLRRPLETLASRLRDPRLSFLFNPGLWSVDLAGGVEADLDQLLEKWLGGSKAVTILDLSGVPPSILKTLVGALLRIIYDALFWGKKLAEGGRERPLLVVLEEAHSYLNSGDDGPAAEAVRKIVREGRKYGIGAMVVSQRPSEVDATVLSQCGTLVALRLANSTDRSQVTGTVSDNFGGFLDALSLLRTGEAIILGEAVHMPMRMIVDVLPDERRPDSSDPPVYDPDGPGGWNRPHGPEAWPELIATWRRQGYDERKMMDREAVASSNISSIGYDAATATLEVEFSSGSVYQYFDVPETEYEGLMGAGSHGSYLASNIKGHFRYAQL
jgi:Helicase HerA, central domain/KTSC domain